MKRNKVSLSFTLTTSSFRFLLFIILIAIFIQLDRIILGENAILKLHDTLTFWPAKVALAKRLYSEHYQDGFLTSWEDIHFLDGYQLALTFSYPSWYFQRSLWLYIHIFVQSFIGILGTYAFFRHFIKADRLSSIIAGILWAIGTYNLSLENTGLTSLPLILFCVDQLPNLERKRNLFS